MFHILLILRSEILGDYDADAGRHSKTQRKNKEIDGTGRPYRRERIRANELSYDDRIHDVIKLLEQIAH